MIEKERGSRRASSSPLSRTRCSRRSRRPRGQPPCRGQARPGRRVPRVRDRHPGGRRDKSSRRHARRGSPSSSGSRGDRRAPAPLITGRASTSTGPGAAQADRAHRHHPRRLRPHRRADGEAGHPAADPQAEQAIMYDDTSTGRARSWGARPASWRSQQRARRSRSRRGAPRARAGGWRALRAGPDQGGHRRGPLGDERAAGHPLAQRLELIRALFEAPGTRDRRRDRRDPGHRTRAEVALEDRRRVARQGSAPVGACVGPRGSRVRIWSSPRPAARRSTSSPGTRACPLRREALSPAQVREVYIDDETCRRPSSCPTTSLRSRSARGPQRPPRDHLPVGRSISSPRPSSRRPRRKRPSPGDADDEEYSGRFA